MNSKRKGTGGENELLHLLQGYGFPCRRNEQGTLAGFKGGYGNPDVFAEIGGHPLHCEVKRTERFRLYDSLNQAEHDAVDAVPIVVHRQNRRPWVVVLSLEDFIKLLTHRHDGEKRRQKNE